MFLGILILMFFIMYNVFIVMLDDVKIVFEKFIFVLFIKYNILIFFGIFYMFVWLDFFNMFIMVLVLGILLLV